MNGDEVKIVDLYSMVRFCFRKWHIWIGAGLICAIVGLLYAYVTVGYEDDRTGEKSILTDEELSEVEEYIEVHENVEEMGKEKEQMLKELLREVPVKEDAEYYDRLEQYNIYAEFYANAERDTAQFIRELSEEQQQYINQIMNKSVETDVIDREFVKYTVGFMIVGIVASLFIFMEVYLCNKRVKSKDEIEKIFETKEVIEAHRNIIFKIDNVRLAKMAPTYLKDIIKKSQEINIINLGNKCIIKEFSRTIEKTENYSDGINENILIVEAGVSEYEDIKIIEKEKQIKSIIYVC